MWEKGSSQQPFFFCWFGENKRMREDNRMREERVLCCFQGGWIDLVVGVCVLQWGKEVEEVAAIYRMEEDFNLHDKGGYRKYLI